MYHNHNGKPNIWFAVFLIKYLQNFLKKSKIFVENILKSLSRCGTLQHVVKKLIWITKYCCLNSLKIRSFCMRKTRTYGRTVAQAGEHPGSCQTII